MSADKKFPIQRDGHLYMCEGGTETEFMYKHGFELPHFATFPLLENPKAASVLRDMYRSYLDVTARHGMSAIMGGLDYRASPDWGALLGYSSQGLADANHKALDFLKDIAKEYVGQLPEILINGMIGPRGDAYDANQTITENEAEDYHSVQLNTLKNADVDLVLAMTFNNIPESIGVAKAAAKVGLPLAISLSLDSSSRLNTGPSLADAITTIDAATNGAPDFYMVNCVHPIEYEPALVAGDWIKRVRGIRPNASKMDKMSLCSLDHLESGDPVELGQQMGDLARRYPHMDIWGGCCGTWDIHLNEIAKNVLAVQKTNASQIEVQ
jgi:S-methylmethionine-dependent homocysteine/selenocysteine methylase